MPRCNDIFQRVLPVKQYWRRGGFWEDVYKDGLITFNCDREEGHPENHRQQLEKGVYFSWPQKINGHGEMDETTAE